MSPSGRSRLESAAHPISPLRRKILLGGAGLLASQLSIPSWSQQSPEVANDFWVRPRTITMRHPSGDKISKTYWSDGELIRPAYDEVCWFMRDRVDGKAVYMHPVLLDIGYGVCGWLTHFGIKEGLLLTSGHRTARRNSTIEGAALSSEHVKGGAMDVAITGVPSHKVAAFGLWLGGGGVGWYPHKNFTHMDRGRLRYWQGK